MRLFEAILDANHRALTGDAKAGLHPDEFAESLPVVALTCIDPRLNPLIPEVLGVREEHFIWLRNAGNIITGPMSSTMRSLALACAVKGGKEIAIVGHTDCLLCKTTVLTLTERFRALGVERSRLPDNINEFFGLFASERQNVMKAVEITRQSPLIGPKTPVHGLVVDITTGKLEWLVNGYHALGTAAPEIMAAGKQERLTSGPFGALPELQVGELKFPEFKIGDSPIDTAMLSSKSEAIGAAAESVPQPAAPSQAPAVKLSLPLDPNRLYRIVGSNQVIYGPVPGAEVLRWIQDGRIDWQALAKPEGSTEWKPLAVWAASADALPISVPPRIQAAVRSRYQSKQH